MNQTNTRINAALLHSILPEEQRSGNQDDTQLMDKEKISIIAHHFSEIMTTLGLNLSDDSLKETPRRVATMFVKEIFSGLDPSTKPSITLFENKYRYGQMLVQKNITFHSTCEHHFVPIIGKAHIAYIPTNKVIGLSKINRIVQYCAQRPQVQERLTMQIAQELKDALQTDNVAVVLDAVHLCIAARGIKDHDSSTVTSEYSGKFLNQDMQADLWRRIEYGS